MGPFERHVASGYKPAGKAKCADGLWQFRADRHRIFVICTGKGGRMIANTKFGAVLLAILASLSQADTITVGPGLIYDFTSIQAAIDAAKEGNTVLVAKGTYVEKIMFPGKNIIVTSTDPNDPLVVQKTTITSPEYAYAPVVTFSGTENESCELTGLTILGGENTWSGGGVRGNGTKATISNCRIVGNESQSGAGGVIYYCDGPISDCTITGNWAKDPNFQSRGGALYYCDGTITNCTVSGNKAYAAGGGLYGCDGLISKCKIVNNASVGWNGGGLSECEVILNCVISNNAAAGSGGGLEQCRSIANCLITGNVADRDGGALHECAEVLNSTISGNKAGGNGGAIYYSGTESIVGNSILWDNKAAEGNEIYLDAPTGDASGRMLVAYCDFQGGMAEVYVAAVSKLDWDPSNIETDPGFVQRGHWTADGAWIDGDYHLLQGSPCIDAGCLDVLPQLGEVDLDGNPRIINGIVDMGAYESRYAAEWHVDAVNGNDFHNGLRPETAFATIQKGIDSAQNGDKVIVYPGTYRENIQFKGKNITLTSTDPNDPNVVAATIIDGGQNGPVVTFNNGESADCILAGFTITNGHNDCGGGIFASNASPVVTNCVFTGNTADLGAAIYCCDNSDLSLEHCTINKNSAGFGGATYCLLSGPKMSDCLFSMNQGTWAGGAVFNDKATPTFSNCTFNDNSTNGNGGGMLNEASSPKLSNCTFSGNSARAGGGIYCESGCEPIIVGGKIAQNHADYGGGIYITKSINTKVTNCCIAQNVGILGAGIYCADAVLTIKQCVFCENMARQK